uniref:Histone H2A/H2B/H3 domain-containing protein n=1 Tax=Panagrolaimus sp. ES5 TaxID=591445 RepID=A0AC34GP04_9BILA
MNLSYLFGSNEIINNISQRSRRSIRRGRVTKRKPGEAAEREIRDLQRTTNNILKLAPFTRIVKEAACEARLVTLFQTLLDSANGAKRKILKVEDLQLVRRILNRFGVTF